MRYHIFLSYSRRDTEMMRRILHDLISEGFSVWTDDNLVPGTAVWQRAIEQAIIQSDCVVVLLSPDSRQSVWVNRELTFAETQGKTIFPVLVRGGEADAVPINLIDTQRVDLSKSYGQEFRKLAHIIGIRYGHTSQYAKPVEVANVYADTSRRNPQPSSNVFPDNASKISVVENFQENSAFFLRGCAVALFLLSCMVGVITFLSINGFLQAQAFEATQAANRTDIMELTLTASFLNNYISPTSIPTRFITQTAPSTLQPTPPIFVPPTRFPTLTPTVTQ